MDPPTLRWMTGNVICTAAPSKMMMKEPPATHKRSAVTLFFTPRLSSRRAGWATSTFGSWPSDRRAAGLGNVSAEPRANLDLGLQCAVHRALVGDLEELGPLFGGQVARKNDVA